MMRVAILLLTVFLTTAANANDFVALVEKTLPGTCVVNAVTETTVIDRKRNYIEEYKNLPKKQVSNNKLDFGYFFFLFHCFISKI